MADIELRFDLICQSGQQVLCRDPDGGRRWFDTTKHSVKIEGDQVIVQMDDVAWRRRTDRDQEYRTVHCEKVKRRCIRCRNQRTMDRNQHICNRCREDHEVREGSVFGCYTI